MLIAIDPGAHGAIVYDDDEGRVQALPMPDSPAGIRDALLEIKGRNATAIMEQVSAYMPGNGGKGVATFGEHLGCLKGILLCFDIPREDVLPARWQRETFGTLPKDKGERKRKIRDVMAARYPHIKVTLANADALGIYTWAKRRGA